MKDTDALEDLKQLIRDRGTKDHAARLRRALLVLAIPATALFTTACYAAQTYPVAGDQAVAFDDSQQLQGVDCNGDGQIDVPQGEQCPQSGYAQKW